MTAYEPSVLVLDIGPQRHATRAYDELPIIIYFHGRGLNPDTVLRVLPAFGGARVLAPDGGVTLKRGTTWFENERIGVARRESVAAAEARFLHWYSQFLESSPRAWLCGFSNGGAFAAHLLLQHPNKFLGAALLSSPLVLPPWPIHGFAGKPIFYGRGTADQVVPIEAFESAEQYLGGDSAGVASLHQYHMGHEISEAEVRDLGKWFAERRRDQLN
jgi:phospholipase/carboxylesterase